jgi:hypothetical protein
VCLTYLSLFLPQSHEVTRRNVLYMSVLSPTRGVRGCLRHTYPRGCGGVCTLFHRVSRRRISFSWCATSLASVCNTHTGAFARSHRPTCLTCVTRNTFSTPDRPTWLVPRPLLTAARQEAYHGPCKRWQQQLRGVYAAGCFSCATQCSAHPFQPHVFLECENILCLCTHQPLIDAPLHSAPLSHSLPLPRVLARKFPPLLAPRARAPYERAPDIVSYCLMLYDSA